MNTKDQEIDWKKSYKEISFLGAQWEATDLFQISNEGFTASFYNNCNLIIDEFTPNTL
jgi:hypothetical protein